MPLVFSQPVAFTEALQSRDVRSLLPTDLSSAEIREALPQEIIDRSVFSARMLSAEVLQEIDDITRDYIEGRINLAEARLRFLQKLQAIGYQPSAEDRGTLKDFTSDERVDLIIRTNAQMAQGYGQWTQGNTAGVLLAYPCAELFRLEHRHVERGSADDKGKVRTIGWPQRWQDVGGMLYDGRMIAAKDSPVWQALGTWGDDSLGNPYPPFAFNSGMWTRDVLRSEAVKLGVIPQTYQARPQSKGFNDDLKFKPAVRSAALLQALTESIGPDYTLQDGVLTLKGGSRN